MSKLVTVDEIITYLDLDDNSDSEVLQGLLDAAEDLLERTTNRVFHEAEAVTDEVHDGTGTKTIYADKPIGTLLGLSIGRNREEAIDIEDPDIVAWKAGERKIRLIDRKFTAGVHNVWLTYDSQEDKPKLAAMAVKEVVTLAYRRRGNEDSRSEKIGDYWHEVVMSVEESLTWKEAVALLHRPVLG